MILKKIIVCALILSAFVFLTGAGRLHGAMKEIHSLWDENKPREAFESILTANSSGANLDTKNLIELTGVRTIAKVLDGEMDETAFFVDSGHVVSCKPDKSMRVCDIETGLSFPISPEVSLVEDNLGVILNDSKYIYFLKSAEEQFTVFEYSLRSHTSRPLGNFALENVSSLYDPEQFQLQFIDRLGIPLKTYDLNERREYPTNFKINGRDKDSRIDIKLERDGRNFRISYNESNYRIPFPGIEFTPSKEGPNLLFSPVCKNAVIIKTDWYPGLYILFDLQKNRAMKIFLPACMDPSEHEWYFDSGILYLWKSGCDSSGLYRINFEEKMTNDDLGRLIEEYNLAHGDVSGEGIHSA